MRYCGILALPRAVLRYSYPPYAPLGKGDGENIDIKDAYLRYVGQGGVVPGVPCNLASICLERKVVIVIVSVLDLCTECVIFFKRFILILFANFN